MIRPGPSEHDLLRLAVQRGLVPADAAGRLAASAAPGAIHEALRRALPPATLAELGRQLAPDATVAAPPPTPPPHVPLDAPTAAGPPGAWSSDATRAPTPGWSSASGVVPAPPAAGRVGPYELVRELARGGMGVVHVARRVGLERLVALKLLLDADGSPEAVERFQLEARVAARLKHPAIVPVHDVGVDERGRPWLVMDLVEGRSLKRRIEEEGPLPPREAAELLAQAASALAFAHARGVLHRDVKPHNILLARGADGREQALVTDFGLAKEAQDGKKGATKTGQVMGTPAYMPPEQAEGQHELVDRRADVYSLGATLYEALAGKPPFEGSSVLNIITAVLTKEPPSLRAARREVARDLETICLTCLEKEPLRRYPTAQALEDDLRRWLADEPIQARAAGPLGRATKWVRRHRVATGTGAAIILVTVASLFGAAVWVRRARQEQRDAARETRLQAAREAAHLASSAFVAAPAPAVDAPAGVALGLHDARVGRGLEALQTAEAWHAAALEARPEQDPERERARRAAADAALALGGAAEAAQQWSVGLHAYDRALVYGAPGAAEARAGLPARRRQLLEAHLKLVDDHLAKALAGDLDDEQVVWAAEDIMRLPHPEVAERLGRPLQEHAARLAEVARATLLAALPPEQRSAGGTPLHRALEHWLGAPPGAPVDPQALTIAGGRLQADEWRALTAAAKAVVRDQRVERVMELVRRAQADALDPGTAAEDRLACLALGGLGIPSAVPTLGAYALVQPDVATCGAALGALRRLDTELAHRFLDAAEALYVDMGLRQRSRATTGQRPERAGEADLDPVTRVVLQVDRGDVRGARTAADRLLADGGDGAGAHLASGYVALAEGRLGRAREDLDLAVRGAPGNPLAWRIRGQCLARAGDDLGAAEDLQRALALDPNDGGTWLQLGMARFNVGAFESARGDLSRATELSPGDAQAWYMLGQTLLRLGELRPALNCAREATRLAPDSPDAWRLVGLVRVAAKDAGGLDDLGRALELAPRSVRAWRDRAQARQQLRDLPGALSDLEEAVRLAPDDAGALSDRGWLRALLGDEPGALADLDAAVRASPRRAEALQRRASVRYKRKELEPALEDVERALAAQPALPDGLLLRAAILEDLGRVPEAVASWEEFLRRNPDRPEGAGVRKKLAELKRR